MNVVATLPVAAFAARLPVHSNTIASPVATLSPAAIVIVIELVDVVDEAIAVLIATPALVPVHVGVCALTQMVLCVPPAVNVIVPLLPIAVVGVAFSTIFVGVSEAVVTSTSPSIAVIAVTELYVATLGTASALETAVAVNAVTVEGFAASSPAVLHVSMSGAWLAPEAAPLKEIVMVSAAIAVIVVMALVRVGVDPACVSAQPASVAGVAAHIDATVLVTVIVVGAVVVSNLGVHVTITFVGVVPSAPIVETCVAVIPRLACGPPVRGNDT